MRLPLFLAAAAAFLHAPEGVAAWSITHPWPDESCDGSVVLVARLGAHNARAPPLYLAPSFLGPPLLPGSTLTGRLARADPLDACGKLKGVHPGSILVAARGACPFTAKAGRAAAAGAAGLVLYQAGANDTAACFFAGAGNASAADVAALPPTFTADAATGAALLDAAGGDASLTMPDLAGPDPGAAVLWALAVAGVCLGAVSAARAELGAAGQEEGGGEGEALTGDGHGRHHHAPTLDARAAASLVGLMACVLLLAFAFPRTARLLLSACFLVGASDAAWRALSAGGVAMGLPRSTARFTAAAATALTTLAWLARGPRGAWPVHDALALALAASVPAALRLGSLASALTLLAVAAANDVWWVFLQPLVTPHTGSVMVAVASGTPALVFLAPLVRGGPHAGVALLGLGDVVIPGLAVAAVARWEAAHGRQRAPRWRCTGAAVAGYGVGLVATYGALLAGVGGGAGQPALLYLSPCVGAAALAAAAAGGELRAQWAGVGPGEVQGGERSAEVA